MGSDVRPVVIVSKCLGFANCRYNGATIPDKFVDQLGRFVDYQPVCAEVEIGLGIPRDPVRVVLIDEEPRLVQPATGLDVTERMRDFAAGYLGAVSVVDGFILKGRSPSCGIKDVKIYPQMGKVKATSKGAGFFAAAVLARFGDVAVEEEGRLSNYGIREHFLTQLYALARFRQTRASGRMRDLVDYQSRNKLLLMAYNQAQMRQMGKIVANPEKRPIQEAFDAYEQHLRLAIARPPRYTSSINVLMHALGYFSDELNSQEKAFFLDSLGRYRERRLPLSALIGIVGAWIARFGQSYLAQQTFFDPYPEELLMLSDSGKGREVR